MSNEWKALAPQAGYFLHLIADHGVELLRYFKDMVEGDCHQQIHGTGVGR
jgi:hypothetical protein